MPSSGAGIVLKMAHLIKDGSQGKKDISDALSNPSPKTLIIPANDLIQVIAKVCLCCLS